MSLYRLLSQKEDDLETFLENLDLNFDHIAEKDPFTMVVLGDFSAKLKYWYTNDSTNFEGSKNDFLTPSFGFHQILKKVIDILNNSCSCIDIIFTTQLYLVIESGVHSSLSGSCHRAVDTEEGGGTFSRSKKKKGKERKARETFKAETIKRLSLKSKLYCLSHSRESRVKHFLLSANHGGRQYFSVFLGPYNL